MCLQDLRRGPSIRDWGLAPAQSGSVGGLEERGLPSRSADPPPPVFALQGGRAGEPADGEPNGTQQPLHFGRPREQLLGNRNRTRTASQETWGRFGRNRPPKETLYRLDCGALSLPAPPPRAHPAPPSLCVNLQKGPGRSEPNVLTCVSQLGRSADVPIATVWLVIVKFA